MSKMVSARVPDALFAQASLQLDTLGATTSDLVNAAFEYVLREKALPRAGGKNETQQRRGKRALSASQKDKLTAFFDSCALRIDMSDDVAEDKRIAHEARVAKYENNA